ncbi:hypothetical protein KBB96_09970 [Luteolibacter ambystomatis]|uniref:Uncharacterized protein n=1 Tax=Luteolibacter ambystomatis TaxID=2824561 RepID=A0A975J3B8_9BACT|nr:hypothetical protein [Luteolibacter ambystomatis]QUE53207.1 hypothetical protein KBB96_09970 [Luteolibacter ambystomatis]
MNSKLFSGSPAELESQLNAWLGQNRGITLVHSQGWSTDGFLHLCLLYAPAISHPEGGPPA